MLQLPGGIDDDFERQQKFDVIAGAMPGFGGKSVEIRYGTDTVVFAGSTLSGSKTISHGLGRTPVVVLATAFGATVFAVWYGTQAYTNTTFDVYGNTASAATGDAALRWIAIG